jgi:hypothetical protein
MLMPTISSRTFAKTRGKANNNTHPYWQSLGGIDPGRFVLYWLRIATASGQVPVQSLGGGGSCC